jgi:hypothetical protein
LITYSYTLPLIDQVKKICNRLAPYGWFELFKQHGLNITAEDLKAELLRDLPSINRQIKGFEDFAAEGKRGIEPGSPSRSLLFHALASPNVTKTIDNKDLENFPTLVEIETVENYVYGVQPPSIPELAVKAQGGFIAIVVFATEYRPGTDTVHRKHADVCFSRTGVSRVGTAEAFYDKRSRGFIPFNVEDAYSIRVLPAKFSAYVAVQLKGNKNSFGPMRYSFKRDHHTEYYPNQPMDKGDELRDFWVPLHKLFDGPECIQGLNLKVSLKSRHVNEKIRRIHLELKRIISNYDSGFGDADINKESPFIFSEGIAEIAEDKDYGQGLVVPVVHPTIVQAAIYRGTPLSFIVPQNTVTFSSSLLIPSDRTTGARHAPEYVHVRHEMQSGNSTIRNLNDIPDVVGEIQKGGYRAQHYIDFTGDGWIEPSVPALSVSITRLVPAYSLVSAPDFFHDCDQREIFEWYTQRLKSSLREGLWISPPPIMLSDERLAPNLQLNIDNFHPFRPEDESVTAIVSIPLDGQIQQMPLPASETVRHAYLPDAASGVFHPGWDVSSDRMGNTDHLASYGLGSPFPEDTKLCAALSTYWPGVSPDTGRSFSRTFPSVSPLTDEEIGKVGDLPWDGFAGPQKVTIEDEEGEFVEYREFDYVDYVESALQKRFTLALTGKIDAVRYESRILATVRAYKACNIEGIDAAGENLKRIWPILSFREVSHLEDELNEAQNQTATRIEGDYLYRIEIYRRGMQKKHPNGDHRNVLVKIMDRYTIFVSSISKVLVKKDNDNWRAVQTE